jgi:[acyl-carrier-protein] S-malonyltransferase
MKCAFLFAGQGSQRSGMGHDLYEAYPAFARVIEEMNRKADFDLKELMFGDDEAALKRTRYTQPALAAFAAGVTAVLEENGIRPDYTAGLSLGEYSALYAAGVFTSEELIGITSFRGCAMEKAGEGKETAMAAILGLPEGGTEEVVEETRRQTGLFLEIANYNTVGQEVISGDREAVRFAEGLAKEKGARRTMELKVSSAFHTSLMQPAAEELDRYFEGFAFHDMKVPVLFNATGRTLSEKETIRELLVRQVRSSVHMRQIITALQDKGVDTFIEIGPGHALTGFVRRAVPGAVTAYIDTKEDMEEVLSRFGGKEGSWN